VDPIEKRRIEEKADGMGIRPEIDAIFGVSGGRLLPALKNFFAGLSRAHAAGVLNGAEVPVDLDGVKAEAFTLSVDKNGGLSAEARSGFTITAARGDLVETKSSATDTQVLRVDDDDQLREVQALLSEVTPADMNEGVPVIVEIDSAWLGESPAAYDDYIVARIAAVRREKEYAKNVFFVVTGERKGRLLGHPDASGLFLEERPAGLENARVVRLAPAGLSDDGALNLPVRVLEKGDVPSAALFTLAIFAGRVKDPSHTPEKFDDAYATIAGSRPEKAVLRGILAGTYVLDAFSPYLLQPVARVSLDSALRYMRLRIRMVGQSA
jgi:hypothetical protein